MGRDVTVVSPLDCVSEAARRMDDLNVGTLPVCDGERLVGTAEGRPARCYEDDSVEEAEEAMEQMQIRRLPVVDGKKRRVGMLSLGDLATDRAPGADETLRASPSRRSPLARPEALIPPGRDRRRSPRPPCSSWARSAARGS